jgi:GH43 family beta-xylosidase
MKIKISYKIGRHILVIGLITMGIACAKRGSAPVDQNTPPVVRETTFYNPLLSSGPDPWIYKKDGVFYFTSTNAVNITLWATPAISDLGKASAKVVWSPPSTGPNSKNIWAPELHYLQGKWYLYYTAGASSDLGTQRCFVLENTGDDPMSGTWVDKGKIGDPAANFFAIDGTVMEYKGKMYFIWSGQLSASDVTQRLYIAEMSNPWTLKTARVQLSKPDYGWEKNGSSVNEGPEALISPSGTAFVVYSGSNCATDEYGLGMLRLKDDGDPLNPADWTKSAAPVFSKSVNNNVFGPGHNGFFKSKDDKENWIVYHANNQTGQGCGGTRSPRIQKFIWNADGTPNFGEPLAISTQLTKPSGE